MKLLEETAFNHAVANNPYSMQDNPQIAGTFHEGYEKGFIEGAKRQNKIDIEDRFGSISHIKMVLQSIINDIEFLTSGNISHNKASIKSLAEGLLKYVDTIK